MAYRGPIVFKERCNFAGSSFIDFRNPGNDAIQLSDSELRHPVQPAAAHEHVVHAACVCKAEPLGCKPGKLPVGNSGAGIPIRRRSDNQINRPRRDCIRGNAIDRVEFVHGGKPGLARRGALECQQRTADIRECLRHERERGWIVLAHLGVWNSIELEFRFASP